MLYTMGIMRRVSLGGFLPVVAMALFVLYGSLFPFSGWSWPGGGTVQSIEGGWPRYISRSDVVTNFLLYVPLGFLAARALRGRLGLWASAAGAVLMGAALSGSLELLQLFLPGRVTSLLDVMLNSAGTLAGALVGVLLARRSAPGDSLAAFLGARDDDGPLRGVGLLVLVLWAVSGLFPLVPSFRAANLAQGVRPLLEALRDPGRLDGTTALTEGFSVLGVGAVALTLQWSRERALWLLSAAVLLVLALKVPAVQRMLTLEAVLGAGVALGLFWMAREAPREVLLWAGVTALTAGFVLEALAPGPRALAGGFNWVPFRGQFGSIFALKDVIDAMWPFMAVGYLVLTLYRARSSVYLLAGGGAALLFAFFVEWLQRWVPGRYPDLTDALLAGAGWVLPWLLLRLRLEERKAASLKIPRQP
jgi:VanZ family protein